MKRYSGAQRPPISACIVACNEADRIEDCIRSVGFCDEVVVVDSGSDDGTPQTARNAGARVIDQAWLGHVAQKEFAIRAASHDWVLCVDADERISDALRKEILAHHGNGFAGAIGYHMPRLSDYQGEWIRHGSWYPNRQLRLFDRRRGCWGGINPHDRVDLQGVARKLRGDLLHYPYRSRSEQLETIDTYTNIAALELQKRGCLFAPWRAVMNPVFRVLRSLLLKRGVLDGRRGLDLALMEARYARLKYVKLLQLRDDARAAERRSDQLILGLKPMPASADPRLGDA